MSHYAEVLQTHVALHLGKHGYAVSKQLTTYRQHYGNINVYAYEFKIKLILCVGVQDIFYICFRLKG
jgi:hypothetical protein